MFEPPEPVEMEFRDGKRMIPGYLGAIMAGLDTWRMTYDQAVTTANKRMEANHLNAQRDRIVAAHFRELR